MTRPQIIIDTETTSLIPNYSSRTGEIWELALIERDCGAERLYRMEPCVDRADKKALEVGRFRERTAGMRHYQYGEGERRVNSRVHDLTQPGEPLWSEPYLLAPHIEGLLDGATIIAANPTFDANYLSAFLLHYGCKAAPWHYRLRDIGSMAWGYLHVVSNHDPGLDMDAGTDDFARALDINPDRFDRHSALGDCRLVAAMLDVIEGGAA